MLKDSILKFLKLDSFIDNITGYVETRIELTKLEIKEEVSKALSQALLLMVLVCVFTLFIMLMSMAVAFKIGDSLGYFGGFAIVAGFYLVVGLLLLAFKDAISENLEHRISQMMNKKKK